MTWPRVRRRPARLTLLTIGVLAAFAAALVMNSQTSAQEKKPAPPSKSRSDAASKSKPKSAATRQPAKSSKSGKAKKKKKATTRSTAVDDKFIVPYIGDNTFIIARIDAARIDLDALDQFVAQTNDAAAETLRIALGADGPPSPDDAVSPGGMSRLRDRLTRFTKAGGRHVYVLVDGDLWSPETVVVVPLRKGADVDALKGVLTELNEGTTNSVDEVGKALVSTSRPKIIALNARLNAAAAGGGRRGEAAARPDLPAAFAAAGDAPIRVSLLPGGSFRQTVGLRMPRLPDEWGGGDPTLLAEGTRWMTLAAHQKPALHLALTIQAVDADSAKKLAEMFDKGVARLKSDTEDDEETRALRVKHLESVKAAQEGERVTMTLPGEFFHRGLPRPMLHAVRMRFFLASGSERSAPGGPPAPSAPSAPPSPPATATVAADDKLILPYLSQDTMVVGRLDVARVDVAALEKYVNEALAIAPKVLVGTPAAPAPTPQEYAQAKVVVADGLRVMRESLSRFAAAGGHHVYALFEGAPPNLRAYLVTPIRAGADVKRLTDLLQLDAGPQQRTITIGQALVTGNAADLELLKKRVEAGTGKSGAERTEFTRALALAGEAPFRIAFVPSESTRKLLEANMPPLPPELGGGDPKLISRGIRSLTLAVQQKPAMSITFSAEAADAATATKLMDVLRKGIEQVKSLPVSDPAGAAKRAEYLAALAPKQQGNTVSIAIGGELLQVAVPGGIIGGMRAKAMIEGRGPFPSPQPTAPEGDGLD